VDDWQSSNKRIESQIWLKVISQQTRNNVLRSQFVWLLPFGEINLCKYGDFSPFFPQIMATFAHFFPPKKTPLENSHWGLFRAFFFSSP
jgi:hypothetical protein